MDLELLHESGHDFEVAILSNAGFLQSLIPREDGRAIDEFDLVLRDLEISHHELGEFTPQIVGVSRFVDLESVDLLIIGSSLIFSQSGSDVDNITNITHRSPIALLLLLHKLRLLSLQESTRWGESFDWLRVWGFNNRRDVLWSKTATDLVSFLDLEMRFLGPLLLQVEETALFDFLFCEVPHFFFVISFSLHRSDKIVVGKHAVLPWRPQIILKDTISVFILLSNQFGLLLNLLDFLIKILQRFAQETALESHGISLVESKWVNHSHGVLTMSGWEQRIVWLSSWGHTVKMRRCLWLSE